jgi:hypothetical protein
MKNLLCLIVSIILLVIVPTTAKADWIDDMYSAGEIPFTVGQCLHDGTCEIPEQQEPHAAYLAGAFDPIIPGIMAPFTWPAGSELPGGGEGLLSSFKNFIKGSLGLSSLVLIAWMIAHPEEVKQKWNEFVQICQAGGLNVPIMPVY